MLSLTFHLHIVESYTIGGELANLKVLLEPPMQLTFTRVASLVETLVYSLFIENLEYDYEYDYVLLFFHTDNESINCS